MKKKRGPQFPLAHFIAIVVITISLFLVVDFARRTASTYKIKNEAIRLEKEIAAIHAQHQALQARLDHVKSDLYVEEIARTQLKWAKPGETVVVVMATPQAVALASSGSQYPSSEVAHPESPWQAWWQMFFHTPPPSQTASVVLR